MDSRSVACSRGIDADRADPVGTRAGSQRESVLVQRAHDDIPVDLPVRQRPAAVGAHGVGGADGAVGEEEDGDLPTVEDVGPAFTGRQVGEKADRAPNARK